jgi:hypothetical protein
MKRALARESQSACQIRVSTHFRLGKENQEVIKSGRDTQQLATERLAISNC